MDRRARWKKQGEIDARARLGSLGPLLALLVAAACSAGGSGGTGGAGGEGGGGGPPIPDADGDTISDVDEGEGDTDGDGVLDKQDTDSDGDGLSDASEAGDDSTATSPLDSDGDGLPNFQDTDSDNNGIGDAAEPAGDLDTDFVDNLIDDDDDGDGVGDGVEVQGVEADCDEDGVGDVPGTGDAPADCDGDGTPNHQDLDSDGDTISDYEEAGATPDADQDGFANYWDLDSDNDGLPDAVEAGDADLNTAALDSDNDGSPDYLDPDSDDDGLSDTVESMNGTSPTNPDSDNDGTNDLIETAAGTNPTDPADNPQANGDFVFVVPYQAPTMPPEDTLEFRTSIQYADVYFAFDTTGSMLAELNAMKNPNTGVPAIVDQLKCDSTGTPCMLDADCAATMEVCFNGTCVSDPNVGAGCIPDLWTGVGRWDELNTYKNLVSLQPNPSVTAAAIPGTGGGGNEAPFQPAHCISNPMLCPAIANMGCTAGGVGCPAFRQDAVRIYVQITDADQQCSGGGCATFTAATAGAAMQAAKVKFVSLYGTDDAGGAGTRQSVATDIALASGTVDQNGNPYVYLAVDGAVVQNAVTAILALARGTPLNTTIEAGDDPADAVDATQFIDYLEVNISGQGNCTVVNPTADTDADSYQDAFPTLLPGTPVCWDVHPVLTNTTVPATEAPQIYKAVLTVRGDGSPLDSRDVYFLIPPKKVEITPPN
jgi:hypothetical protein